MPEQKESFEKPRRYLKSKLVPPQEQDCYEGERLARLLKLIQREIESARLLDGNSTPEKLWFKQRFSIGVNDVTRVLERMAPCAQVGSSPQPHSISANLKGPSVQLQAVLLASDCNPRLKTAIAIGVKVKGNAINQLLEKILDGDEINRGTNCLNTISMPDAPCQ
ncbi:hypothetical protein SLA2020_439440 [Shorea laevis]